MIPSSKVKELIPYKDHLTTKQKKDILKALQTGSFLKMKPTQKQVGSGLWTVLASIGVPMLIDALSGKGLQVEPTRSRRSVPIYVPQPPSSTSKKKGGLKLPINYRPPPPFFGTWEDPVGMGMKPKKKDKKKDKKGVRFAIGEKQPIQRHTIVGSNTVKFIDKPLSNYDLINWVKHLGIKYFRGIFSRDNLPNKINQKEVGIINLDSRIGPGTHWVC